MAKRTLHSASLWLAVLLLSTAWSSPAPAFNLSSSEPIHVSAQKARIDDAHDMAVYTGDVVVTQGKTRLTGNQVTIYRDKTGVSKIEATGSPATYHEPASPPKNPATDAKAATITYSRPQHLLTLTKDAEVKQRGNIFRGNVIRYDTRSKVVTASGSSRANGSRVEMIIEPKNPPGAGKTPAATSSPNTREPAKGRANGSSQGQ